MTGDDHAAVTVRGGGPAAETGIIEVHIQKTEIGERKTEIGITAHEVASMIEGDTGKKMAICTTVNTDE